jgi:ATP-binding cassette subfamily F protein 3
MRQALTEALVDFKGAMVVVAHDRHLLRATCDEFWWVHNGRAAPFDGDLEDYRDASRIDTLQTSADSSGAAKTTRRDERREEAQERQRIAQLRKPIEKKIALLEKQMVPLSEEKLTLETWLSNTTAYSAENRTRLAESLKRQGEIGIALEALERQWLDLTESLEWVR